MFNTQSKYHNVPSINGFEQVPNRPYAAKDVSTVVAGDGSFLTLRGDLTDAYPKEAGLEYWKRIIYMDINVDEVKIEDFYKLEKYIAPHKLNFMTTSDMIVEKVGGGLILRNDNVRVKMELNWQQFNSTIEKEIISVEHDKKLEQIWGKTVQRFSLVTTEGIVQLYSYLNIAISSDKPKDL